MGALHIWCALPCTSWCSWHHVHCAKLGSVFSAELLFRRKRSFKLVAIPLDLMLLGCERGGGAHFEWPRHCMGWKQFPVRKVLSVLSMEIADLDGCCFCVRVTNDK